MQLEAERAIKGGDLLREQEIENRLRQKVERAGGLALKFISPPGAAGMPDRVVLLPGKRIFFVELKALGADLRPLQLKERNSWKPGFQGLCYQFLQYHK